MPSRQQRQQNRDAPAAARRRAAGREPLPCAVAAAAARALAARNGAEGNLALPLRRAKREGVGDGAQPCARCWFRPPPPPSVAIHTQLAAFPCAGRGGSLLAVSFPVIMGGAGISDIPPQPAGEPQQGWQSGVSYGARYPPERAGNRSPTEHNGSSSPWLLWLRARSCPGDCLWKSAHGRSGSGCSSRRALAPRTAPSVAPAPATTGTGQGHRPLQAPRIQPQPRPSPRTPGLVGSPPATV